MRKIMRCRERSNKMAIYDRAVKLKHSRHVRNQQCKIEKLTGKARKWLVKMSKQMTKTCNSEFLNQNINEKSKSTEDAKFFSFIDNEHIYIKTNSNEWCLDKNFV